jgi:hypothetical protein
MIEFVRGRLLRRQVKGLLVAGGKGYNPCIGVVTSCLSLAFLERPPWRWRRRFCVRLLGRDMRLANRLRQTQLPARDLSAFRPALIPWGPRPRGQRPCHCTMPPTVDTIPASRSFCRPSLQSMSNCRSSPLRGPRSVRRPRRQRLLLPDSTARSRLSAALPTASPAGIHPQTHRVLLRFQQAPLIGTELCGSPNLHCVGRTPSRP